ncbi:hypothetical protein [Streptosporangium lutulentum]|uniref:Uncharacterized protein n=1 Tax=Streptosporangium lutulentum TaxID=1461250 RepID=A0ABT9QTT1_9ACTN|nr:hypothetical protein [Streptosporangium lutulentum]MDP9850166.1 hypothetical protein [Streptosporangium lutulentum]
MPWAAGEVFETGSEPLSDDRIGRTRRVTAYLSAVTRHRRRAGRRPADPGHRPVTPIIPQPTELQLHLLDLLDIDPRGLR